jgi:hypothetical protein
MANDEAFGALDFQHNDIQLDADNDLLQQLLSTFSNKHPRKRSLDAEKQPSNSKISNRNTLPNAQPFDEIKHSQLESDVEDRPHTEAEPQLLQQRDNVLTVDPVPDSRFNLQNKNRLNHYTFLHKVLEKWTEVPRRTRRCARSLDQKS